MSIVKRFRAATKVFLGNFIETKAGPYSFPINNTLNPTWSIRDYQTFIEEGLHKNSIIARCINLKSSTAAQAKLKGYRRDNTDKGTLLNFKHPLQRVLRTPNPYMSAFEFFELLIGYLNIAGSTYVVLDPLRLNENNKPVRKGGFPAAFWPVRPDRMRPIVSDNKLMGYVYDPTRTFYSGMDDRRKAFLPEQVIQVKYMNLFDDFEGLGEGTPPLLAASRAGDTDNKGTDFIKAFFDNSGVVSGLIKTKQKLVDTEVDKIKERWREMYGHQVGRQWDIAVLDMDTEYQQMGLTFEGMAFQTLDFRNEARICMAFNIHPTVAGTVLGLTRSTYSNPAEARKAFWQDTMMPEYTRFKDGFAAVLDNEELDIFVQYDYTGVPALQEEQEKKINNYVKLVRHGVPPNMAAAIVDIRVPDIPNGDIPLMTSGTVTLEQIIKGTTTAQQTRSSDTAEITKEVESQVGDPAKWATLEYQIKANDNIVKDTFMIAFYPEAELARQLAVPDGEVPGDLHITLDLIRRPLPRNETESQLAHSISLCLLEVGRYALIGKIGGFGIFNITDNDGNDLYVHYASVNIPKLEEWRTSLCNKLGHMGYRSDYSHGFTPHITLLYSTVKRLIDIPTIPLRIDSVCLRGSDTKFNIDLSTGEVRDSFMPEIMRNGHY